MIRTFSILFIMLSTFVGGVSAQSLSAFRERLAEPVTGAEGYGTSSVTVVERGDAAESVAKVSRDNARLRFKGFRVCIFFDNGPDARGGAAAACTLFKSNFPDTHAQMTYNSPYFTVTAGNCVTAEEAIILMGKVKGLFPKAFLKNEDLSVADLVQ